MDKDRSSGSIENAPFHRRRDTSLSLRDVEFNDDREKNFFQAKRASVHPRCGPKVSCSFKKCIGRASHGLFRYFVHVGKTTVRRGITVFDVVTDVRLFLILWRDDSSAYWSCFLLASLVAPFLVFWSSMYNFLPATRTLDSFSRKKPSHCCEHFARLYYTLISFPVIGLVCTMLVILYWWLAECIMGCFCKSLYRRARARTEKLSTRFSDEKPRTITALMPYDSMRFFTISELFFESLPQLGLQIVIYLSGASSLFTFQKVVVSVCASIMNIIINGRELQNHAMSFGMRTKDYILFFMSGSLDSMLEMGTPIRLFASSKSLRTCSIMAFSRLYNSRKAVESIIDALKDLETPHHKELLLPVMTKECTITMHQLIQLALILRAKMHHSDFIVSFDKKLFHDKKMIPLLGQKWLRRMVNVKRDRRKFLCCPRFVTCFRKFLNNTACLQFGDVICGSEKFLVEDVVIQEAKRAMQEAKKSKMRRHAFYLNASDYVELYVQYLWPIISENHPSHGSDNQFQMIFVLFLYLDVKVFLIIVESMKELGKHSYVLFAMYNCVKEIMKQHERNTEYVQNLPESAYRNMLESARKDIEVHKEMIDSLSLPTHPYDEREILYEVRRVFRLPTQHIPVEVRRRLVRQTGSQQLEV